MSKINDGGPAYPLHPDVFDWQGQAGMSLRDHFAAQALPVVMSQLWAMSQREGVPHEKHVGVLAADFAYEVADAMLAARAKGGDADG